MDNEGTHITRELVAVACPNCRGVVTSDDVLDPAYECRSGHYFTRPEAGDSNICPECSRAGRRIGTACPECRELLDEVPS